MERASKQVVIYLPGFATRGGAAAKTCQTYDYVLSTTLASFQCESPAPEEGARSRGCLRLQAPLVEIELAKVVLGRGDVVIIESARVILVDTLRYRLVRGAVPVRTSQWLQVVCGSIWCQCSLPRGR